MPATCHYRYLQNFWLSVSSLVTASVSFPAWFAWYVTINTGIITLTLHALLFLSDSSGKIRTLVQAMSPPPMYLH